MGPQDNQGTLPKGIRYRCMGLHCARLQGMTYLLLYGLVVSVAPIYTGPPAVPAMLVRAQGLSGVPKRG